MIRQARTNGHPGYFMAHRPNGARLLLPEQIANAIAREFEEAAILEAKKIEGAENADARQKEPVCEKKGSLPGVAVEAESIEGTVDWIQVFDRDATEDLKTNRTGKGRDYEKYAKVWLEAALRHEGRRRVPALAGDVLKMVFAGLAQDFPNFRAAVGYLRVELALAMAMPVDQFRVAPILLHGEPGIGKTAFCAALSDRLGLGFEKLSAGGMQGPFDLSGSSSHWSTSHPGRIFHVLANGDAASPVLLIDEVDKVSTNTHHPILPALLDLLEPDSARHYRDEAVGLTVDASRLIVVTTANDVDSVPPPLRSRLHQIEITLPTTAERRQIAQGSFQRIASKLVRHRVVLDATALDRLASAPVDLRVMIRTLRQAVGMAVLDGRQRISEGDLAFPGAMEKQRIGFV